MLNLEVNIYVLLGVRKHFLSMIPELKYLKGEDKNLLKTLKKKSKLKII